MPKEREREKEGLRCANKEREREREREIALSNLFLISQTQKSLNPFVTDRREPRNRQTHSPPIVANPEVVAPFFKPEIVPPNRQSACSGSILLWVDLVADPLALFDL